MNHHCFALSRRSVPLLAALFALAASTESLAATGGTVTYTNPSCSSFVVSGTPPTQTVTCVPVGAGPPSCAPTANPPTPAINQQTTITANCSNGPLANSYVWTGATCIGVTGSTCTVLKSRVVSVAFSVSASNASGAGPATQFTVAWH